MPWQIGGNFQPMLMICEYSWKECPNAVFNYLWKEIITDVIDWLDNDVMAWHILIGVVACVSLIIIIYCKLGSRDKSPTITNQENFNTVGGKVKDLELKLNILTYKIQYGTWPLPHQIKDSDLNEQLCDLQVSPTNSNNRNVWLKRMLQSPAENNPWFAYSQGDVKSNRCFAEFFGSDKKCTSSDASSYFSDARSSITGSLKSIEYKKYAVLDAPSTKKNRRETKSENLGLRPGEVPTNDCTNRANYKKLQKRSKFSTSQSDENNNHSSGRGCVDSIYESKQFVQRRSHPHEYNTRFERRDDKPIWSESSEECSSMECFHPEKHQLLPTRKVYKSIVLESPGRNHKITNPGLRKARKLWKKPCLERPNHNHLTELFPFADLFGPKFDLRFPAAIVPKTSLIKLSALYSPKNTLPFTSKETLNQTQKRLESFHKFMQKHYNNLNPNDNLDEEVHEVCQNVANTIDTIKAEIERNIMNNLFFDKQYQDQDETCSERTYLSNIFHVQSDNVESHCDDDDDDDDLSSKNVQSTISTEQESKIEQISNSSVYPEPMDTEEDVVTASKTSSLTELAKETTDSEGKSTSTLLHEAFRYKQELLTRIQTKNLYESQVEIRELKESFRNPTIVETEEKIEYKHLDIITEERSSCSLIDKSSESQLLSPTRCASNTSIVTVSSNASVNNPKSKENDTNVPIINNPEIIENIRSSTFLPQQEIIRFGIVPATMPVNIQDKQIQDVVHPPLENDNNCPIDTEKTVQSVDSVESNTSLTLTRKPGMVSLTDSKESTHTLDNICSAEILETNHNNDTELNPIPNDDVPIDLISSQEDKIPIASSLDIIQNFNQPETEVEINESPKDNVLIIEDKNSEENVKKLDDDVKSIEFDKESDKTILKNTIKCNTDPLKKSYTDKRNDIGKLRSLNTFERSKTQIAPILKNNPRNFNNTQFKAKSHLNLPIVRNVDAKSDHGDKVLQRRSRSYVTPRKTESSPRTPRDIKKLPGNNKGSKPSEQSSSVKISISKSSIPVLKSRLEKRYESRTKSPMRSPLTMTTSKKIKDCSIVPVEGPTHEYQSMSTATIENPFEGIGKRPSIFSMHNDNFLGKTYKHGTNKPHRQQPSDELNQDQFIDEPTNDENSPRLPNSWIEQREMEVHVKPSVTDNSTSISDLQDAPSSIKNHSDNLQIFGLPKEITKAEYMILLEAIERDKNLLQLQGIKKLCDQFKVKVEETN